jgi:hypothetical protein
LIDFEKQRHFSRKSNRMTPSRSRKHTWEFAVVLLGVLLANPADGAQSSRAFPGPDGSLVYTSDAEGNRIPDFSVAGYQGGGVPLPNLPVVANVAPIAGDNTAHLQAAIDVVELRTPDANGFRGAVLLAPGDYPISSPLLIRASGVVLRGSGTGTNPAVDTVIRHTGTATSDVIQIGIGSTHGFSHEIAGTRSDVVTDRVLVGDHSFEVADAQGYAVGDNIVLYHPCTLAWLTAVDFGATGSDDPWTENSQPLVFNRRITEIDGNRITIDAPLFNTLDRSLAQSHIFLADRSSILENIGVESLRVTIDTNGETSEDHAKSAIVFTETENCWVRDVISEHFVYSGVLFRTSTRCTALDCEALDPHSVVTGGKRYNFNVEKSQLILFENCYASNARHAFVGNGTSRDNGIVFLNCVSSAAYTSSEGHRRWGMGFLYDGLTEINVRSSGLRLLGLYSRGNYGTGHGWSLAHSVAWNCDMGIGSASIQKPPTAQNYAIGCRGTISGSGPFSQPAGFIELTGSSDLEPASLYRQQLLDRQAEPIEVYLLIGQSNMSGRGRLDSDPDSDAVIPDAAYTDDRLQHWDHALAIWQTASDPLPQHDLAVKPVAVGPGVSFGWGLLQLRDEDQRIGLVPSAHGGTSIQEWQKNPTVDPDNLTLYADALSSVANALSGNARIAGIIWHQGESDLSLARDQPATYRALLHQLIQDLRADIAALDSSVANPADIPFIAGTLLDSKSDYVDDILLTLPAEVANTDVARATGLTAFDGTHFTSASQRLLGFRYAHLMARLQGSELPPFIFPYDVTLREGGDGAALQWIFHEAPASLVTLNWIGTGSSGVSFFPAPPEYRPEDWPTPASILLRASDDAGADPPIETIAMASLTSSDPLLNGAMLNPLRLTRLDNDSSTLAQLTPGDFTSLGVINAGTSAINFNTDTLTVSGGLTGIGELIVMPSGAKLAVFTFSGVDLQASPTVSGQRGLAILSQSDLTLGGSLSLNGGTGGHRIHGLGAPGGFDGGDSIRDAAEPGFTGVNGKGPGGSPGDTGSLSSTDRSGGGAGYGGVGGDGEASGGMVAGDLQMSELLGGSGAGATFNKGGGGGGGALALGAVGDLAIEAGVFIQANGGGGAGSGSQLTSGGGSGGGMLVFGSNVTIDGALRVNGGNGGSASGAQANGGGGSGGRIAVYYQDNLNVSGGLVEALGGQPAGANAIGQSGAAGTIFYSDLTPLMGPGDFAYAIIEDFESHTLDAAIAGQCDWGGDTTSASEFSVRTDPDNPLNQVLHFNQGVNKEVFINSPALRIPDNTTSTFFFRMRGLLAESGAADLWLRLSLSDAAAPFGFGDGETDLAFADDGAGNLTFGDAGSLTEELWHGVWIVVDHASDTLDVYIQPEGGVQTQAAANQAFRNGSAANEIVSFMIKAADNGGAGSNGDAWFDDFYIAYGLDAHTITPSRESKLVPAITWSVPTPVTYGTALDGAQLNAMTSVPGSFSYSPPTGAALPAGTHLLESVFTPDDSANYTCATASVMLTVDKATLTVTAHDMSKTYRDSNPALTYAITDFVNGEDDAALTSAPAITTTANTFSDAGQYPINTTGGEADNYVFGHEAAMLTIQQRALSITTQAASRVYGASNPAFTPVFNGFASSEGPGDLDLPPSLTSTATPASPVALYSIQVFGASDINYAITHANSELSVLKAPLTLTAENKGKDFGESNPPLTVKYFGFVNGDDSFSLDTPVTLATTAVQNSPTGSYPINASGAVDHNYAITHLDGTLTIGTSILRIRANNAARLYGAANPTFSVFYEGFIGDDDENVLDTPVTLTTPATSSSPVGQYPITPGGATDSNYTLVFIDGTFDVTPASLRIIARNTSRAYGSSNPPFAVNYEGFLNGDDADDLDTTPTVVTTAIRTSPVGPYPIIPDAAADANYFISYVNGNVDVINATVSMTANVQSRPYGSGNPTLSVTYDGFVNGEEETILDALPEVTTTASPDSPIGMYPITVSGATAPNYTLVPFHNFLTITKVPLRIEAVDASRTFGAANPTFTVEYFGFVNSEDENVLSAAVALSTPATESSPPGMYPIVATGAAAANYVITYANGEITVTPAMLRIRANSATRLYGDANPTFEVNYLGFASGDDESVLDAPVVVSTTATPNSPVAAYDITPSNAADANYAIVFENGALTVTPAPLEIQPKPQTRIYGAADPPFTASYSGFKNGDAEADLDTPPTTASSANATSPVGTYALTVSAAADTNYAISYQPGELTVTPAALDITALNAMRPYGGADPLFSASYQGFVNGDTASDLDTPPSFSTSANAASGIGMYEIAPLAAADANYIMSYFPGMLEIVPASLKVRAGSHSRIYGAPNPTFSLTYEGFVNDEAESDLLTPGSLSSTATPTTPVGDYTITASGATAQNYAIEHIAGTLRIDPATLTATANNKSRTYGSPNPALTVSYSGFVNDENDSVVTQPPMLAASATLASPVSTYSITLSGGAAANYQLHHVEGTLNVTPASLTVTAENKFRNYGAGTPQFTAAYVGFLNGDGPENLDTPVAFTTTANRDSVPKLYRITPGDASDTNYSFDYRDGFLVVAKAPLTVVADNQTKSVGTANPPLSITYDGFANGENEAVLSSPPQISSTANQASPGGAYPITVAGAEAANYELTFQAGTMFVNPPIVPSVALTAPTTGATFPALATIHLTANATIDSGEIGKVEFFRNGIKLGEDTTFPFSLNWPNAGLGVHRLTAIASTSSGEATLTSPVNITVVGAVNSVSTIQGDQPAIALLGEIDVPYLIQASDNLKTWQTVGTITGNGLAQTFVEQLQASAVIARFYRIIEAP